MRKLLLFFLILILPIIALGEDDEVPKIPVAVDAASFYKDGQNYLVLEYTNHPHWHTYWKNPGDAGLPLKAKFKINGQETKLEEMEWPAPDRYIEKGNMWAYGYEGTYLLYFKLPTTASGKIEIQSTWLVCKHICVPGKVDIVGNLTKGNFRSISNTVSQDGSISNDSLEGGFEKLLKKASWPNDLDLVLAKGPTDTTLVLYYSMSNVSLDNVYEKRNILTPFLAPLFDFKHEFLATDKKGGLFGRMEIDWDGEYEEPPINLPADGKFKTPYNLKFIFSNPWTGKPEIVEKRFDRFSLEAGKSMGEFFKILKPIPVKAGDKSGGDKVSPDAAAAGDESGSSSQIPLWKALILALIGGFILNFMPCVLPVISIKLFGLIKNRDAGKNTILKHNVFYTLGVVATFFALGLVVLALKSAGEGVGWGFQLQSPHFVAFMVVVLFIFTLNLFGLFEFQTPGGSFFGNLSIKEGVVGDFLSGCLATILSTPCSAPFLGTALTFAFSASSTTILLVFIFIGLGLSIPFILTGIFPSMVKILPQPGKWMEDLKKFLGLTLILTTIWLFDVFQALTDGTIPSIKLNTILALIFFAFYFQKTISKKVWARAILFILPMAFFVNLLASPMESTGSSASDLMIDKKTTGLDWEAWSKEKMQEHKDAGNLVFMDFTAKWCFTCKVNEKLVLETSGFKELVSKYNIKLLLGDWTKRDEVIGGWLKSQGLVGVPAYFIQKPDGTLINLGETITLGKIEKNLN